MIYDVFSLQDTNNPGSVELVKWCADLSQDTGGVFGTFPALFGLSSNEIYLVTYSENGSDTLPTLPDGIRQTSHIQLTPTVRPVVHTPRSTPGIYVFRWFWVNPTDIDEIVDLSNEAWTLFEGGFDTEVQGLFKGVSDKSRMLLITWYKDLSVWEASRNPAPEARENFMKRHRLTERALPVCTRLAGVDIPPALVSET